MQYLTDFISFNIQLYIFIISALVLLLILTLFCVHCNDKKRTHRRRRTAHRPSERLPATTFTEIPLKQTTASCDKSLTTFLESAQVQIKSEQSVVKETLLGIVTETYETYDEPAANPRTVEFVGRKSLAPGLHQDVTSFGRYRMENNGLERQYKTINASYKFNESPDKEKSREVIYANFETLVASNFKKKDSFGSEQMIAKKSLIEETEPPALETRFTVQKSEESILSDGEGGDKKKQKAPYEHLHLNDDKKVRHQYENHEIINKSRGFVSALNV